MVLIAIVIGGFVLISAALLIVLCMFSSRLSQAEGRTENWSAVPAKVERRPYVPGSVAR